MHYNNNSCVVAEALMSHRTKKEKASLELIQWWEVEETCGWKAVSSCVAMSEKQTHVKSLSFYAFPHHNEKMLVEFGYLKTVAEERVR